MPRPRVYSTPAIVLRQRKLGDADKILTLYTANLGKIEAVAKGVRKARSRLAGHVEPLSQATFLLAKGKTLDVVTQVQTIEPFQALRDDLDRLSRGLYACELLEKFTEPREPHFDLYRLLLDQCITCRAPLAPVTNYWNPAGGGVVCPACRPEAEAVRPVSTTALK